MACACACTSTSLCSSSIVPSLCVHRLQHICASEEAGSVRIGRARGAPTDFRGRRRKKSTAARRWTGTSNVGRVLSATAAVIRRARLCLPTYA